MSSSPGNNVEPERSRSFRLDLSPRAWRSSLILVLLIIGCNTVGILVSLTLPAVQSAREAARRVQCVGNLEKIGVAMQSYHQEYACFPPSFLPDKDGKPMHSWRVLLLPFLGEQDLYARYRFDEPWNSPHNMALADQMPAVYRCPSDRTTDPSQTSYAMIIGPHAISDGPASRCLDDIEDGPANTIMVVEGSTTGIHWLEPRDLDAKNLELCTRIVTSGLQGSTCEIFCNHDTKANVLFCDGSARTLTSEQVRPEDLETLATIDGSEPVRAER